MKNISYEKAMSRLEEIIISLEGGNIPLDDSLKLFEEGTRLSVYCSECITKAEQKIIELTSIKSEEDVENG